MRRHSGTAYGLDSTHDTSWVTRAACRDADPELFSPLGHAHVVIAQAVSVCARCPMDVRLACLLEGEATGDAWTVRGGRTGPERDAHRLRGLRPQEYPPHKPGVVWCRRCHLHYTYNRDDPSLKLCPGCRIEAKDKDGRKHAVCVDCERVMPIHCAGRCSGCFGQYRRIKEAVKRCLRCDQEFRPPRYKPKAHICSSCAAAHPEKRVRDQHAAVAHA